VANAGVLVTIGDAQVLIDAPIRDGIPPYATSSSAERERLERATAPYDRVDAVLVTHWHEDHFSPEAVAAHLSHNTRAVLVSSPEVVERVRAAAPGLPGERLRAVLPPPGAAQLVTIGRLPIRVLRIRHNPTRRLPEQHVGFLVGASPAVLHTGDADPQADNFALLRELPRVDLALVPFWFLLTDSDRQFVNEAIRPERIVAMHLPPKDADDVRRRFAEARVRASLLVTPGAIVH
jgi:L-ascorbate metabolism protein UlaG (beta-lactamase superfamily)